MQKSKITIGLTGNPNTGKSTLFNALTGAKQHTANWPGKTVEKKEGKFKHKTEDIRIIDLPGSYSLTAYTEEEIITSQFIAEEQPDVILQIIDSQNLERNLFMTIQLIELGAPLVIALNMLDLAKKNGIEIKEKMLSTLLGVPVISINAKQEKGIDKLIETAIKQSKTSLKSQTKQNPKTKLKYGNEIDKTISEIKSFLTQKDPNISQENISNTAIKLLEGDLRIEQKITGKTYYVELKKFIEKKTNHLEKIFNKNINNILTQTRYGYIKGLSKEVISNSKNTKENTSDKIDKILINKFSGIPIFLFIAWLMFQATFKFSAPLMNWIEQLFTFFSGKIINFLAQMGFSDWFQSLIVDGIIGGVGGILVFTPIIGILFIIMAILEDSGYMARVAYLMDKLMHKIGLHGKAFIPLMLGFGCNVPGIMATRTLETKQDRLLAILINPFMSCGARLPVYALFAGVFFSAYQGWIIFSLYILGIIIAILAGLVFKKLLSKKLSSPFVMELPPYRMPSLKGVLLHAWSKIWSFIQKAGTIILAFSIIIWLMASLPVGVEYGSHESFAGTVGETISPVFRPLGFDNWQSSVALGFGFVAKEVVVGTFGTLYGAENFDTETDATDPGNTNAETTNTNSFSEALQEDFTPLSAYAFMVFTLLYMPCIAVLSVVKRETGSWKWPAFMIFYTTSIAWIMAFIVYQGGLLIGLT